MSSVYPRVCGEAWINLQVYPPEPYPMGNAKGLPPRVRGSLRVYPRVCGEAAAASPNLEVYPRVCGERQPVYPRVCGEAPRQVDIRKPPSFPKGIPHLYYTKYNTDVYNGGLVVLVDAVTIAWTAQTRRRGS